MKKATLISNLRFLAFGLAVAAALTFAHAFSDPTATPPGNNLEVPLHNGPGQVKNGSLSVGSFLALQNASFKQQTFLNGVVFAGLPGTPAPTVIFGDSTASANLAIDGNVSAAGNITSGTVKNSSNLNLCADANGTIVTCSTGTGATDAPGLRIKSISTPDQYTTYVMLKVYPVIQPGDTYSIQIYSYTAVVQARTGDTPESIVGRMVSTINNADVSVWGNPTDLGGSTHFPPRAASIYNGDPSLFNITLDSHHTVFPSCKDASGKVPPLCQP